MTKNVLSKLFSHKSWKTVELDFTNVPILSLNDVLRTIGVRRKKRLIKHPLLFIGKDMFHLPGDLIA